MRTLIFTVILLVMQITCAYASEEDSGVMVTELTGMLSADGKAIALFDEVQPGRTVALDDQSKVTLVVLKTGKEYTFTGPAKIKVNADTIEVNNHSMSGKTLLASNDNLNLSPKDFAQPAIVMRGLGSKHSGN